MMPEQQFWAELKRLLLQDDMLAATVLVQEHLEAIDLALKEVFEQTHPTTIH